MSLLSNRVVNVITLGRMGFMPAYDVQMRFARQHLDELAGKPHTYGKDTLLLVEHSPVYTVGIRNKDYTEEDVTRLKNLGAEFYKTNRGGLITFHGPGQLVAYPILNLQHFKPSMRWYVGQLEKTLINTLQRFGLQGRTTDQTGVWVKDGKIASIGLHGSRYVTTHGVSLNCNVDLPWFKHIVPCGLQGVKMTSLTKELEHNVPAQDAVKPFLRSFQDIFDCTLEFQMLDAKEMAALTGQPQEEVRSDQTATPTQSLGVPVANRIESSMRHMSTDPMTSHPFTRQAQEMQIRNHHAMGQSAEPSNYLVKTRPMW